MRRGDERVDRESQARRAVDDHRIELVEHRRQPILEPEVRVELPQRPSSLARAIRDGATHRFGCAVGLMTSAIAMCGSTMAS
jgi:hypothetical protein